MENICRGGVGVKDYRVCENKYGWYKVQEYILVIKTEKTTWELLKSLCCIGIFEYQWVDVWPGGRVYRNKEEAIGYIDAMIISDRIRREQDNDEWNCG